MKKLLHENLKINATSRILNDEDGKRRLLKENLTGDVVKDKNSANLIIALENDDVVAQELIQVEKLRKGLLEQIEDKYGEDGKRLLDML